MSDADVCGVGLQIGRDKITEAADVRFLIWKKKELKQKGQRLW